MSWLLLGVFVVLLIFVIIGIIKGFSQTLLSLASIALSLVIAWFITPSIHTLIQEKTTWETSAAQKVSDSLLYNVPSEEAMDHYGEQLPLPQNVKDAISITSQNATGLENKKMAVSLLVTGWLVTLLIELVMFIILEIILSLVGRLLSKLIKKTDLAKIDRVFGGILGIVEGALIVDAILLLVPFFTATPIGPWLNEQITVSKLMTWIYDHNVISMLAFMLFDIKLV